MKTLRLGFNAVNQPLTLTDDRRNHQHIIGSSGSGKSKFLEQMIRGDLHGRQGFCLIDPHGSLYNDVVKYAAYRVFEQDIILLNLSEPKHIVGFNFFSKNATGDVSVQVDNRISATLHAWGVENADQTPTLERILRLVYTTLIDADLTLPQVATLLDYSQKEAREKIIAKIQNDLIRREWQELSDLPKARDFRDETLSAKNRLFRLLTSKVLMQFLGIKGRTIDLLDAMNNGKVILVNLAQSENLSRENARVFGSLLVNQFFESALRRLQSGTNPTPYYLYLDEFQNFVSIDLCNMLDEVRKFGLFLILSHQRFGQLNEDIEDAVLTNCRIKTVFGGLRTEDAKRMAEELFIGKIDPKKIKVTIYQLKHWYKYTRDQVYTSSWSRSESTSQSHGEGSGSTSSSQDASFSGQTMLPSDEFFTGAMWLGDSNITALSQSESSGLSKSDSQSSFSSESYSASYSESEGVADIPVFVPMPFQELSSIQYYTPEEQLLELTQALKLQQQRHCFIQLPNKETQPLLVPFVKEFTLSEKNFNWFIEWTAQKNNAITSDEANKLLTQGNSKSDITIDQLPADEENGESEDIDETPIPPREQVKKKNIFDQLKKGLQE